MMNQLVHEYAELLQLRKNFPSFVFTVRDLLSTNFYERHIASWIAPVAYVLQMTLCNRMLRVTSMERFMVIHTKIDKWHIFCNFSGRFILFK